MGCCRSTSALKKKKERKTVGASGPPNWQRCQFFGIGSNFLFFSFEIEEGKWNW